MRILFPLLYLFSFTVSHGQQNLVNFDLSSDKKNITEIIKRLKKKDPTASNLVELGDLYYSIENYRNALKQYNIALSIEQNDTILYKVALVNEKLGQRKKALKQYEYLWEKDSLNLSLTYRISKLQILIGEYPKAQRHLLKLMERDSTHPVYPYKLGLIHTFKKEYDSAIDHFLKAFKIDSTYIDVIYQLAKSFRHLNIKDSTNLFIKTGLQIDPNHKNLNRLKINILRRDKEYETAIELLLKQDSLYPSELYNAKMLGICNFNLERYEKAKKWFEISAQIDPFDYQPNTYLGHIFLKQKDSEKAFIHYSIATRKGREPRDEEYLGLGICYLELEDFPNAIKMFTRAFEENRRNHHAFFELALASDRYYADKKIGYKKYQQYIKMFAHKKDSVKIQFIKSRMGAIKEKLFLKGEIID